MGCTQTIKTLLFLGVVACSLPGCNGGVFDEIDAEIDSFEVSPYDIDVGDRIRIEWVSTGAFSFGAKVYLSDDRFVSPADVLIIDERCGLHEDRHCRVGHEMTFSCYYRQDLELDCEEGNELLAITDISGYLDEIPKDGFIILELCNDNNECESRSKRIRFN